jgi:hypothetical protein
VIIDTGDLRLWTDPWLESKAFNDSWTLYPAPVFDPTQLRDIDFLWISHEHPDHFNVPTLRGLPAEFKQRVTVLFQENNSQKMFAAFAQLGFPKHRVLPHDEIVRLSPQTEIYCYQVGQMDSCLGVRASGRSLMNINDAVPTRWDCRRMRKRFGEAELVLNQFSIAGYAGFADRKTYLTRMAREHLDMMVENHRDFGAKWTLPFASFIVFSTEDNRYVNTYANKPRDVVERFRQEGEGIVCLYPGDEWTLGEPHDPAAALARFDAAEAALADFRYDRSRPVSLDELEQTFVALAREVKRQYPALLLRLLRPVVVEIPDLDRKVRFGLSTGRWEVDVEAPPDLRVDSQPLWFTFKHPFGAQTLGVSARLELLRNEQNWVRHRTLFAMRNAEIYLRPSLLLRPANLRHFVRRRRGLVSQVLSRVALFSSGR